MENDTPIASVPVARKTSRASSDSLSNEKMVDPEAQIAKEVAHDQAEIDEAHAKEHQLYVKLRPYILAALAALILGWWISSTIMHATRHRWYDIRLCRGLIFL